jgi:AcrR family transcriptional regulator
MVVYYFPTKDDLFLAVVEDVYAAMVDDMEQLLSVAGSARARLRSAFVRLGHASDVELDVIRLAVREGIGAPVAKVRALDAPRAKRGSRRED